MVTVHYLMEPRPKIRKYSLRTKSPKSSSWADSVCVKVANIYRSFPHSRPKDAKAALRVGIPAKS